MAPSHKGTLSRRISTRGGAVSDGLGHARCTSPTWLPWSQPTPLRTTRPSSKEPSSRPGRSGRRCRPCRATTSGRAGPCPSSWRPLPEPSLGRQASVPAARSWVAGRSLIRERDSATLRQPRQPPPASPRPRPWPCAAGSGSGCRDRQELHRFRLVLSSWSERCPSAGTTCLRNTRAYSWIVVPSNRPSAPIARARRRPTRRPSSVA